MIPPSLPPNETERLQALRSLDLLDTAEERAFDDLTRLAGYIAGTPICLVSLIDEDRQWFKSRQGLEACQTSREISFCGHAILQEEPLIVPDTLLDERFADNPLVLGPPYIRFYLGIPLVVDGGFQIGTLCMIDRKPRQLDPTTINLLKRVALQVVDQIVLRRHNQNLEEIARKSQEAMEAKSNFLANMSHEIRTPLNAVIGITELVSEEVPSQEHKKLLGLVRESAGHLMRLLNDILDLSRLESGGMTVEQVPFEIRPILDRLLNFFRFTTDKKGLDLHLEIDPRLPVCLKGDAFRLEQILINLLGNAVKFTNKGSVVLRVMGKGSGDQMEVVFEVRDTGIGMTAEQKAHIFEAFKQADSSTSRSFGGSGLGLAIVARLVDLLGGKISVRGKLHQGSSFIVTLPMAAAGDSTDGSSVSSRELPVAVPAPFTSCRILLAEDNPVNQVLAEEMLLKLGHQVVVVGSGGEALEALEREPFDLVLMDIQMPGMDGLEATKKIRTLEKDRGGHVPIVAMTAHALKGDRERCLASGMDAYLAKPITFQNFSEALKSLLSGAPSNGS